MGTTIKKCYIVLGQKLGTKNKVVIKQKIDIQYFTKFTG